MADHPTRRWAYATAAVYPFLYPSQPTAAAGAHRADENAHVKDGEEPP